MLSVVEYSLISIVGTLINDQGFALAACNIVNIIAKLSFYMSITSYQFVYLFFFSLISSLGICQVCKRFLGNDDVKQSVHV